MTVTQFFEQIYPLILNRTIDKFEKRLDDGTTIKAYWVVDIIRIDIRPG